LLGVLIWGLGLEAATLAVWTAASAGGHCVLMAWGGDEDASDGGLELW
jgi:hypothetical protein